jgi:hypothetical protein
MQHCCIQVVKFGTISNKNIYTQPGGYMKAGFIILGAMAAHHAQQRRHEEELRQRRAAAHRRDEDRRRQEKEKARKVEREAFEQKTSITVPNRDSPTYLADLLKQREKAQNPALSYRIFSRDPKVQDKKSFYTRCLVEDTQDNIDLKNETRVNMRRFVNS